MKRMPQKQLYGDLSRSQLPAQAAQACLVSVVWSANRQLGSEFLCRALPQTQCCLLIQTIGSCNKAEPIPEFVLRQLLHADDNPAAGIVTAGPRVDQVVNLFPTSEIEIA